MFLCTHTRKFEFLNPQLSLHPPSSEHILGSVLECQKEKTTAAYGFSICFLPHAKNAQIGNIPPLK